MSEKVYTMPNPPIPNRAVEFDPNIGTGCNLCVKVCPDDVMMPNPEKGSHPLVLYAEGCGYCSGYIEEYPREGAITMLHPTQ